MATDAKAEIITPSTYFWDWVGVPTGTVSQLIQVIAAAEAGAGATAAERQAYAKSIAESLDVRPAPPERPKWYKQWWFWLLSAVIAGGGLATTAGAVYLLIRKPKRRGKRR